MVKTTEEDVEKTRDKLVQTTLTASFTSHTKKTTSNPSSSPYFTKPPPKTNNSDTIKPPVDLYPSRRAPPKSQKAPSLPSSKSSHLLSQIAAETKSLLPGILLTTPHSPATGQLYKSPDLPPLQPSQCPALEPTPIRVLNADSIDAALSLSPSPSTRPPSSKDKDSEGQEKPVLILNMANAYHSGGGWLHGALAQEEALCYRTSLSFTLKTRYYPIPDEGGIYSPTVVVIRESMARGHELLDLDFPDKLPVISVVSVAAIRAPATVRDDRGVERYKKDEDRAMMKVKMRTVLRIAAGNGHRKLVLGALGCGAFGNPREEVVGCWGEVFGEEEFGGGWWEEVVFAVMDGGTRTGMGNFGTFEEGLGGVRV